MKMLTKLIAVIAPPLLLTGCLFLPGKFDATLKLTGSGQYQFTYAGEMQIVAGDDKEMSPPKLVPFNPKYARCSDWIEKDGSKTARKNYDRYLAETSGQESGAVKAATEAAEAVTDAPNGDGETFPKKVERKCTDAELADLEQRESERYERREKDYEQRSEMMAMMFGGAVPGNDKALERFAQTLLKYDGWEKVEYAGKNIFNVEYRASGNFDRYFAFPVLNDASMQYPFFQIVPRKSGELEVMTPAVGGSGSFLSLAMLGGMPSGRNKDMPIKPIEGSFTLETDGEILANNSPDGYRSVGDSKVIRWKIKDLKESPRALIKLD